MHELEDTLTVDRLHAGQQEIKVTFAGGILEALLVRGCLQRCIFRPCCGAWFWTNS